MLLVFVAAKIRLSSVTFLYGFRFLFCFSSFEKEEGKVGVVKNVEGMFLLCLYLVRTSSVPGPYLCVWTR